MQNNKVLKKLLAVSAVAAMFSAFGVHAQNLATLDSQGMIGRTTIDGTGGNTDSAGMESRSNAPNRSMESSGADEQSGSGGTSGTVQGSAGTSGSVIDQGTSGSSSTSGQSSGSSTTATGGAAGQGTSGTSSATGTAAAGATSGSLSKEDQKILMDLARANMAEVEAGKIAQSKSQNDQVKSFAQQMIDDHTKALTEVQQVAQAKGVTLPTEPDSKHKSMAAKLEKMSGESFDKTYMAQAGLSDHKTVLAMLKKDAQRAKDPEVKALAEKMTPVVEQHLKAAQQMPPVKTGTTSGK